MTRVRAIPGRPPLGIAVLVTVALSVGMIWLRLVVYPQTLVPLAYSLPLLIALWHGRRALLWGMAACYFLASVYKIFWIMPAEAFVGGASPTISLLMQWANFLVTAAVLQLVLNYRDRLERANADLALTNAELEAGNEELAAREEEISQQNEELREQTEELEQQSEELQAQTEELQSLNEDLAERERTLHTLLQLTRNLADEGRFWEEICGSVSKLLGPDASGAAILEWRGAEMAVRATCGFDAADRSLPRDQTLGALAMECAQTAQLEDVRLRPDLVLPRPAGGAPFSSALSAPMCLHGEPAGVIEAYCSEPRAWAPQQAQLLQWLAGHCSQVWESIRLRDELARRQSDLEAANRSVQAFFRSRVVGMYLGDVDGRIADCNEEFARIVGRAREDIVEGGVRWEEISRPEDLPADRERLAEARTLGRCTPYEKLLSRPDGQCVPVLVGYVLLEPDRTHSVAFVLDITAQKQTERELERAMRGAEEANQAKSQFLANISHELRTPMNAILGMMELALGEELSPTVRDCLETAKSSADLLLLLLNELLDFSRIEAGKLSLAPQPFALRALLDELMKMLDRQAAEQGLQMTCDVGDDVPDNLVGDPFRLRQVLINLLGNALKFTPKGRVALRVQALADSDVAPCLGFAVSDTGIGISAEDQRRIFAPFAQGDNSTTRQYGGTGLGLAISAHLVKLMGGRIQVESRLGEGSTFSFSARFAASSSPAATATPARLPWAELPPSTRTLRILLAEDTPANQKLVSRILDKRGHRVEVVGNGKEALARVERDSFDLVLMDVQMPLMDGFQATAAIRSLPSRGRTPIVAMTAHALQGDQDRCLSAGMDAYVSKPINAQELISLVERLADGRSGNGN